MVGGSARYRMQNAVGSERESQPDDKSKHASIWRLVETLPDSEVEHAMLWTVGYL